MAGRILGKEVTLDEHIADIQTDEVLDIYDVSKITECILRTGEEKGGDAGEDAEKEETNDNKHEGVIL